MTPFPILFIYLFINVINDILVFQLSILELPTFKLVNINISISIYRYKSTPNIPNTIKYHKINPLFRTKKTKKYQNLLSQCKIKLHSLVNNQFDRIITSYVLMTSKNSSIRLIIHFIVP